MTISRFFFKQKTAYEVRISDLSSDVCSSDLFGLAFTVVFAVVMTPFVRRLDLRLRRRLTLAAGLYFGGALGVEMLNADVAASAVDATYRYVLQTAAEEAPEMIGRASCRERVCQYV